ncbi:MAG: hypothetical protein V4669_11905 [Pseudomonadota bacterium]
MKKTTRTAPTSSTATAAVTFQLAPLEKLPPPLFSNVVSFLQTSEFNALLSDSRPLLALGRSAMEVVPEHRQLAGQASALANLNACKSATPVAPTSIDRMSDLHKAVTRSCAAIRVANHRRRAQARANARRPQKLTIEAADAQRELARGAQGDLPEAFTILAKLGRVGAWWDFMLTALQALELSPSDYVITLALQQFSARRFTETVETVQRALRDLPEDAGVLRLELQTVCAYAWLCQGEFAKASAVARDLAAARVPDFPLQAMLAHSQGKELECVTSIAAYFTGAPNDVQLAELYAWIGQLDLCLHHLELAVANGHEEVVHSPLLDPVRNDAYFQMTLRRLKMSAADLAGIAFDPQLPPA